MPGAHAGGSDFDEQVFGLPQLEILDLSRNNVSEVPEEIDKMKALRVFAIQHNRIADLPLGLGEIGTLRMLKVTGNPLNPNLKSIVEGNEDVLSPTTPALPNDENERDKILTRKVIDHLRTQAAIRDSGEDSRLVARRRAHMILANCVSQRWSGRNTSCAIPVSGTAFQVRT